MFLVYDKLRDNSNVCIWFYIGRLLWSFIMNKSQINKGQKFMTNTSSRFLNLKFNTISYIFKHIYWNVFSTVHVETSHIKRSSSQLPSVCFERKVLFLFFISCKILNFLLLMSPIPVCPIIWGEIWDLNADLCIDLKMSCQMQHSCLRWSWSHCMYHVVLRQYLPDAFA